MQALNQDIYNASIKPGLSIMQALNQDIYNASI